MIQALSTGLVLIAATTVQMLVPQFTVLADAKAPVVLCLVIYYGLTRPARRAMVIAFLAGLLIDALGAVPLGYSSVCFALIALAASLLRHLVFEDTLLTQLCFGAVGSLVATVGILLALGDRISLGDCSLWWLSLRVLFTVLLGAAIAPMMFGIGRSMDHVVTGLTERPVL